MEILHLDELGYGPQGKHTRREWRKVSLDFLTDDVELFNSLTTMLENQIEEHLKEVSFSYKVSYEDGKTVEVLSTYSYQKSHALDFTGHVFEESLALGFREFKYPLIFSKAVFKKNVSFNTTTFRKNADFVEVQFLDAANFQTAAFVEHAIFGGTVFKSHADFTNASIQKIAHFKESNFEKGVTFEKIRFVEDANFSGVKFNAFVNFEGAQFLNNAIFKSTKFYSSAIYRNAEFHQQCRFDNIVDIYTLIWEPETLFEGEADFENALFKNVGHFERVQFKNYIPSFLGVDNATTRLEFSSDNYFAKTDVSEDAIKRFGLLKRLADEHGQTDQALMFNAFELRAKAKQLNAGSILKITTNLYEYVSDYGRSFAKPMLWYGVLICLSALFAMIYSTYSDSPAAEQQVLCKPIKDQPPPLKLPYGRAVVEYAMFRAGGLMDFTDTGKQNNAVNCRLFEEPIEPPLMRAWGIFKGIASIALLFLAALGLRNKYRIK